MPAEAAYVVTNFIRHLTNFRPSVLGGIDACDSESRRIMQRFSRSAKYTFRWTFGTQFAAMLSAAMRLLQTLLVIVFETDFMTNVDKTFSSLFFFFFLRATHERSYQKTRKGRAV